ncbi:MAG: hypothetical protein ACJ749_10365 [Flavisolibacter sp.]
MKRIFAILIVMAAGCSNHKNSREETEHHSRAETAITDLVDSFRSQYTAAPSDVARESVFSSYKAKTERFLSDHYLNHMRVHVDSIIINHLTVDTRFHAGKNVVFTSSMEFRKRMPKREDSLFRFMKNLRPGTDTNIDFIYIGKFELHPPNDSVHPTLIVNAYPLSFQVHGR